MAKTANPRSALKRVKGENAVGVLGPLGERVVSILNKEGPTTVGRVHEILCQDRALAYNTVMTVMSRLAARGVLNRTKQGARYVYSSSDQIGADASHKMSRLFRSLMRNFSRPAIQQFVEAAPDIDDETLKMLEKEVRRARAKRGVKSKPRP